MLATGIAVANEILKPLSPDFSYRRRNSFKQNDTLVVEENDSLSSSLPLGFTNQLDDLKEGEGTSKVQTCQKSSGYKAQRRGSGGLLALAPRPSTQLSPMSRPRSASLYSSKKSFLGLAKTRPTSAKHSQRSGKQGSESAKESSTLAIDTALAKIRNQLDQLSEEDQIMEDRIGRLMSEISQLMNVQQKSHARAAYQITPSLLQSPPKSCKSYGRTQSDKPFRQKMLDGHQGNTILSDLQETWEEFSTEKILEDVNCVPSFDLVCKTFEESPRQKRDSLDSTGSVESPTESAASSVCVVIVTDTSRLSLQGAVATSQSTSGSSQAEDDVFFSQ